MWQIRRQVYRIYLCSLSTTDPQCIGLTSLVLCIKTGQ